MNIKVTGNKIEILDNSDKDIITIPLKHAKTVFRSTNNGKDVLRIVTEKWVDPYFEIKYADIVNVNEAAKGTFDVVHTLLKNAVLAYTNEDYNLIIDEDTNFYYFAKALPGTATNKALWQCKKTSKAVPYITLYANGSSEFNNIATSIKTLTYA